MKKFLLFVAALLLGHTALFAQSSDISAIVPSSAPAFTILGASPTEIAKPNNWNALQAQLTQSFTSNNQAIIPKNFAVEFSPYWLSDHKNFTYDQYLNSNGFSLRNLKISFATSKIAYGTDSAQAMGFGFRIPIQIGRKQAADLAKQLTASIDDKKKQTTAWQSRFMAYFATYGGATVGNFISDVKSKLTSPPQQWWKDASPQIKAMLTDTIEFSFSGKTDDSFAADQTELLNCIQAYMSAHNMPIAAGITKDISAALKNTAPWEISGAFSLVFPTSQFSYSKPGKFGLWSDYTFELDKKGTLETTVALRYIHSWAVDTAGPGNAGDLLARFSANLGSAQKFSLSGWALIRRQSSFAKSIIVNNQRYYNLSGSWDNKFGVDISYKISDNVAFAYSFGKGYGADPFSLPKLKNQLISFLSLYYSINTKVAKSGNDFMLKSF